ncbi:hypothetical protein ACP70R_009684 [Stipagrostis hirtigluma subsp. patula]
MEPAGHGAQSSMMAVSTKAAEGRSLAPYAGGGVDLISALCDDVLVRILELLPDVRDAARTDALSRRWRGLWTRMRALRLVAIGRNFRPAIGTRRLIAFVNKRLSQRARMVASLDHLQISLVVEPPRPRKCGQHLVPPAVEAAQAWIRHAVQQAVKSFELHLRLPYFDPYEKPEVILDELGDHALGSGRRRAPAPRRPGVRVARGSLARKHGAPRRPRCSFPSPLVGVLPAPAEVAAEQCHAWSWRAGQIARLAGS